MIDINERTIKSYADETNLWRALENLGLHKARPVVVYNRKGRCTAIFGEAALRAQEIPVVHVCHNGFPVIN